MLKKVKLLYIDNIKITRDFFELGLKNTLMELITLEDLETFEHNFEEFQPDLVLLDAPTFEQSLGPIKSVLLAACKKEPAKFVICGKIEEVNAIQEAFELRFLKPYSPHHLDEQIGVLLKSKNSKEVH